MMATNDVAAWPREIEPTTHVDDGTAPFSATPLPNVTAIMAVVDAGGDLVPLCTAGDLLRWCKMAWNAERD